MNLSYYKKARCQDDTGFFCYRTTMLLPKIYLIWNLCYFRSGYWIM